MIDSPTAQKVWSVHISNKMSPIKQDLFYDKTKRNEKKIMRFVSIRCVTVWQLERGENF